MSSEDETTSDEAGFRTELRALLRRAHRTGVDVEGGWECRNGAEHPDWDVIVAEVEKPGGSE